KELQLYQTQVSDAGLVHFRACKGLMVLTLWGERVTDAGIGNFKDCKGLTWLKLEGTRVTDAGLACFAGCKDLTYLHLGAEAGMNVTDAGLACFKGCPLTELRINNTRIADLTPLQGMSLEHIRLTPKNITRGLDVLRSMKSLKTIGIDWDQPWPAAEFWE